MKLVCLSLAFSLISFLSFSQNWNGVNLSDTSYYVVNDADGYLRCIWVDSATANGGDSTFYFYKAMRDSSNNFNGSLGYCGDSLSKAWMGDRMIRNTNGVELYFNLFDDTLVFETMATLGDTWILNTDSNGINYNATVTALSTQLIDGVLDSVKTITIQCDSLSIPVSNYYNTSNFKLSKHHGFIKTTDLFQFPYYALNTGINRIRGLPFSHERIDKSLLTKNLNRNNVIAKYQVGNAWIVQQSFGGAATLGLVSNTYTMYDSVLNVTIININNVIATIRTRIKFDSTYENTTLNTIDTITIYFDSTHVVMDYNDTSNVFTILDLHILPEYYSFGNIASYNMEYFFSLFCDEYPIITLSDKSALNGLAQVTPNCYSYMSSVSGGILSSDSYFSNFGTNSYWSYYPPGFIAPDLMSYSTIQYLKIDSCMYGSNNLIFPVVLRNEQLMDDKLITIFPNPVSEILNIKSGNQTVQSISIYDCFGKKRRELFGSTNKVDVSQLPNGTFFIKIVTEKGIQQYRFLKL